MGWGGDAQRRHLSGAAGARQLHQLIAYAPQDAVLVEASLRQPAFRTRGIREFIETWLHRLGLAICCSGQEVWMPRCI